MSPESLNTSFSLEPREAILMSEFDNFHDIWHSRYEDSLSNLDTEDLTWARMLDLTKRKQ